jgi:D-alanyl-D-alanine dipeptidase
MIAGFVAIDEVVPEVRCDAKYATWDNFTGKPVEGYLINRVVGSLDLCIALGHANAEARMLGLGLLLWDGYRPQRAVDSFVRWARRPEDGITKQQHYPNIERHQMFDKGYVAERSGHTRGSAVDLTLFSLDSGDLLQMGGGHDVMDAISHHGAAGISADATLNRELLRRIMEDCGFAAHEREWWHYSLRDEPHPNTYFDFPISHA